MTDEELQRAIEAALDVRPSGEFVARVRIRAARERPRYRFPLMLAVVPAAAALLMVVWSGREPEAPTLRTSPRHAVAATVPPLPARNAATPPAEAAEVAKLGEAAAGVPSVRTLPLSAPAHRAKPMAERVVAEVLISENERAGLRLLLRRLNDEEFAGPVRQVLVSAAEEPEAPPIEIEAIVLNPAWAEAEGEAQ